MDTLYQSYFDLLDDLSQVLEKLTKLSNEKTAAVRQDDLLGLDAVLKQEQAMTLNLRGLEQRRQKLVGQLGLQGTTLSDLPRRCPPHLELPARQVAERLHRSYEIYQGASGVARSTLECNLHVIEKVIAASGVDPNSAGAGYTAPGAEPPKNMKTDFRA